MSTDRYITEDGVEVGRGDLVFYVERHYAQVRSKRLSKDDFGWRWVDRYAGHVFVAERPAIELAIRLAMERARKARQQLRTEESALKRLTERLEHWP